MEKSQVTPPALGAGYLVFFLYSAAIGAGGRDPGLHRGAPLAGAIGAR